MLLSCCSESIEGPVYESPQGCHALNKPNLRADRQKTSTHALNKLHPTQPPRVVSYVPVVTDTVSIYRVIIAGISYYIDDALTPILAMR